MEETAERISKKAAAFSSEERGRELPAAEELRRRHLARWAEARAVADRLKALHQEGDRLAARYTLFCSAKNSAIFRDT